MNIIKFFSVWISFLRSNQRFMKNDGKSTISWSLEAISAFIISCNYVELCQKSVNRYRLCMDRNNSSGGSMRNRNCWGINMTMFSHQYWYFCLNDFLPFPASENHSPRMDECTIWNRPFQNEHLIFNKAQSSEITNFQKQNQIQRLTCSTNTGW